MRNDDTAGGQDVVNLPLGPPPRLNAVQAQQLLHGAEEALGAAGHL